MFIMKKQITFLVAILATTFMVAQVPTIDFEGDGVYIDGGLINDDCESPRAAIVDDPEGTNGKVAQLQTPAEAYHSYSLKISHAIDFSDATKRVLSVDFYQSEDDAAARTILLKVGGNAAAEFPDNTTDLTGDDPTVDNWAAYEVAASTAATSGWQTLTFDFSDAGPSFPNNSAARENISGSYTTLDIFIDFDAAILSTTAIDNIGGGSQGAEIVESGDPMPTVLAPTPDLAPEKVKSIFSNTYSSIINTVNHGWDGATVPDAIEIQPCEFVHKSENIRYTPYSDADYATYDVSDMTHIRVDYWTETGFEGILKLEAAGGKAYSAPVSYVGDSQWHTVEIALTDYTDANSEIDMGAMAHIIVENVEFGTVSSTLFIDNIYYANLSTTTTTEVSYMVDTNMTDFDMAGGALFISADTSGDSSYDEIVDLTDEDEDGVYEGTHTVDFTAAPNFDFWVTYEDANGTAYDSQRSASCDAGLSADESFNAVIDGKPTYSSSIQLLDVDFTAGGAFACYSVDSYVSTPQMASDSPSDIAGDVMSLYSDYYAPEVARGAVNNMEVITWDASWGPADTGEVDMGGNMVRYYTSSYTGIDVQPVDLTSYDMMHIDLWAQNGGEFNVKLVDFAGDGYAGANPDTAGEIVFTHDVSSWKSVDIALADFMDATKVLDPAVVLGAMSDINQIVVVSSGTTYLDNFYFYQSDQLSNAELNELGVKAYPNPTRNNWMINASSNINSVEVYNVLGKQVLALKANSNKVVLSGAALNNGIYFARVNAENGSKTLKLVKN